MRSESMENKMWENPCPTFETMRCENRQEESRCQQGECQEACKSHCGSHDCQYMYNVSYVQLTCRARERYLDMMKEIDGHLKKHHSNAYAGMQVYETASNMFVVVTKYYDTPECRNSVAEILNYVVNCYVQKFGRGIRRRQILNFNEAERIFC